MEKWSFIITHIPTGTKWYSIKYDSNDSSPKTQANVISEVRQGYPISFVHTSELGVRENYVGSPIMIPTNIIKDCTVEIVGWID